MKAIEKLATTGRHARSCGIAALLSLAAAVSTQQAQAVNPYPDSDYLYKQYANSMNYRLWLPPTFAQNPTAKFPLVIFVHGAGENDSGGFIPGNPYQGNSAQMADLGQYSFVSTAHQAIFPCIFVLVQKTNANIIPIHQGISGLIDELVATHRVDPDRVVITGLSGGGNEVLQMAQYHHNKIAALVPVCTVIPEGFNLPSGAGRTPVWFFHAINDTTQASPHSAFVNSKKFSADGGTPIFTLYDTGGHGIWGDAYATTPMVHWLADQRRGQGEINSPATVTFTSPSTNPASVGSQNLTVTGSTTQRTDARNPVLSSVRYARDEYLFLYGNNPTTGTVNAWSTGSVALNAAGQNTAIEVAAVGTDFNPNRPGVTYYTKRLNVTYTPGGADVIAPSVTITSPTSAAAYTQTANTINLSGSASDNIGVTSVEVHNDRTNTTTTATGTTSWSLNNITLLGGANVLTVRARDAANNQGTDVLTVTVNAPQSSGWTGTNIDSTGGSHGESAGSFTLSGRGTVWGPSSGMYYLYKQADGNCEIITRVTGVQNTNWNNGKAGVMIRESLAANSKHVFIALTHSAGSVFYSNDAGQGIFWTTGAAPYWLKLTRAGNVFNGSIAPDVSGAPGTWTQIGTRTITMASSVYIGMGVSSNDATVFNTSTFDHTTTTGTPEEWQTLDIGTTGGSASVSGDVFSISGKGSLWSGSDQVRYIYQSASGDCSITARVTSVSNTNWGYGRAGVMIRETATTGSPYVYFGMTSGAGAALHSSNPGNGTTYGAGISAPYWIRLTRSTNTFTAEVSSTGAAGSWTTVGTRTMTMGTNVLIGLGAFSNDSNVLLNGTIDGVSVTP